MENTIITTTPVRKKRLDKKKVMTVFGTRPEAIKMAPVIGELQKHQDKFETVVAVTAQHREMLDQVLDTFDIKPDCDLGIMREKQSLFHLTILALARLKEVLSKEKPDLILVQGDTTTTFIASLAAFYLKIKVGHIEAGLRTYDKFSPFPEGINRHLTSCLADLHFAPTRRARENLLKEGVEKKRIFVTGNTVVDALFIILKKLRTDRSRTEFLEHQFSFLNSDSVKPILVTAHRRENFGKPLENICSALKEITKNNPEVEIIYPVHLNPNVRRSVSRILKGDNNKKIHLINPLDYESFIWLMDKSFLILTDSGGVQEEAPSLGKPVLLLRRVTKRPEALEAGTVRVIGLAKDKIVQETQHLLNNGFGYEKMSKSSNPYGDGKAAQRIVNVIRNWLISK